MSLKQHVCDGCHNEIVRLDNLKRCILILDDMLLKPKHGEFISHEGLILGDTLHFCELVCLQSWINQRLS